MSLNYCIPSVAVNGFIPTAITFALLMPIQLILNGSTTELDAVVFDCDGVLLETIPAKLQAYMDWMPPEYESLREVFKAHNLKSFGQSRSVQLRYFYEELANREVTDDFLLHEVDRFASICEPLCKAAPWAEGSKEFVEACQAMGTDTFVLSGTPQRELLAMLDQRNASRLFNGIYGFPITKAGGLLKILDEGGYDRDRVLFIGDAEKDASAALQVGVHFVYRPSEADRPLTIVQTETKNLMALVV